MSKIEEGMNVKSTKHGVGKIVKIITKSTGYVEVSYNGTIMKEMAFNLTDIDGKPLKSKPKSETSGMTKGEKKRYNDRKSLDAFNSKSNLEKIKSSILRINGLVQGDRNSMGYQLIHERLSGIWLIAKEKNNDFIVSVIDSIEKWMKATEKQAYAVAKFADDNGIKYEDN